MFRVCCGFFVFYPFGRMCVRTTTVETYHMVLVEQCVDIIKQKIATLHWLLHTHLIAAQKRIEKFLDMKANHECILRFSRQYFDVMKLIFTVKWIFYAPDVLISSIMSLGLMISRYWSIVSYSLPSLLYSICLSSKAPVIFFVLCSFEMLSIFVSCRLFLRLRNMTNNQLYHSYQLFSSIGL